VGRGTGADLWTQAYTRDRAPIIADSIYLLMHPLRYPLQDIDDVLPNRGPGLWDWEPDTGFLTNFVRLHADEIRNTTLRCTRRIALIDPFDLDDLLDEASTSRELTEGIDAEGWELLIAERKDVGRIVRRAFVGTTASALVGGFARRDCVARALGTLRRLGLDAFLHELATLPLTWDAYDTYCEMLSLESHHAP
jgi:hypothetical protein